MKRKKLIAALTSAVMAVTMLPSIAMAATPVTVDRPYGVGAYESVVQVAPDVSDSRISQNVRVDMETVNGTTIAKFTTLPGKKLPYIERCDLFTDYVSNHNGYKKDYPTAKDRDDLALANGNYVKCRIIPGTAFTTPATANPKVGYIRSVDHPAQSRNTLGIEERDYGSGVPGVVKEEVSDSGSIKVKAAKGDRFLELTLWVPVSGSETFKIIYPEDGSNAMRTETLKLDFSGIACETADESDVSVTTVEPTAVDKTFPKLNTDGMGNFVNRNVVANYNLDAHLLTLTNNGEGYVPYKTGFRNFSKGNVAAQEGNYVALTFTVGAAWVPSKESQFELSDLTNYSDKLEIVPNSYPTDLSKDGAMWAEKGSRQVSVMKLLDAATLDQKIGKFRVSSGSEHEDILVDYSKLNLVNKKEAGDAAAAASLIESTIPSATGASKQTVETAKDAYDALTPGGKAQLQMMHTEAYDTLMAAEKALTDDTSSTTKPTNTSTTSDVVKEGTTVKVKDATYKVTGSKTVTYKKAPKNKKNVKVPATIKIKGKSYKVTAIANNAFKGNKKVKTVTVGKNVKTIGSSAFQNCKALTKVTLPAKTTTIKKNAFANSKKLKTVIVKSKKMTKSTVKANAFKKTSKKATFNVPNNKVKAYTKLFRQKGLPKACKIK